MLAVFLRPSKK